MSGSGIDERALRGWSESSRQLIQRRIGLIASDTWPDSPASTPRSKHGRSCRMAASGRCRTRSRCSRWCSACSRWRLRIVGAYRGGTARTQFVRIAGGIAIAALLGWVQARLFVFIPPLPDKAAFVYSAVLICAICLGRAAGARHGSSRSATARGILQRRVLVVGFGARCAGACRSAAPAAARSSTSWDG